VVHAEGLPGLEDDHRLGLGTHPRAHGRADLAVNPDDTLRLYGAPARHAGMRRLITVDDPRVACDTLMWEDGTLLVVLTWHAAEPLTVKPAQGCDLVPENTDLHTPLGTPFPAPTRSPAKY